MTKKQVNQMADTAERIGIDSWDAVDKALRSIGEHQIEIEKIEGRMNEDINAAKGRAEKQSGPLADEIASLRAGVVAFMLANKASFIKTRTRKFMFGKVSFRTSTAIVVKQVEAAIEALKALKLTEYIRTTESLDKKAMQGLDDDTLAKIGAYRMSEDKIGIEPDIERILIERGEEN